MAAMRAAITALLVGLASVSLPAPVAPDCPRALGSPLSYEALREFVVSNRIRSIDELLPCLPADVRRDFTLVYGSRSPERYSASPSHPRVILFGPDAHLLMAFTGDPGKPFFDRLQLIEFRNEGSRFFFAEASFPGSGPPIFQESPVACTTCHGDDGRPIWDAYDLWPGVYGSSHDLLHPGSRERRYYEAFLARGRHESRYRWLDWTKNSPVPPYHDDIMTWDPDVFPNLRLSKLLARYNAKRIARSIEQSPRYESEKYRIVRGLLGCEPLGVPLNLSDEVSRSLRQSFAAKVRRNRDFGPTQDLDVEYYAGGSARALRVAQLLDVNPDDWSLALEKKAFDFQDGDATLDDFLLTEIFRSLAASRPEIRRFMRVIDEGASKQNALVLDGGASARYRYKGYDAIFTGLGGALLRSQARPACELLQNGNTRNNPAEAATLATAAAEPSPSTEPQADEVPAPDSGNPLQRYCGNCHSGEKPTSTRFPLDDETAMRRLLRSNPRIAHDFMVRVASSGKDRMPPRPPLTEPERTEIQDFIQSLEE
jgi:hypothetical protein